VPSNKSNKDSIQRVFTVALVLCVVCSVVVSVSAVLLKPAQVTNKQAFLKRNMLEAAGMYNPDQPIEEQFSQFAARIVDLQTGTFTDAVDPETYDQERAAKDPDMSREIPDGEDIAGIGRRAKYAKVFTLDGPDGIEMVVLPIKGYGLWGTLYGYLALEGDGNTIVGLSYYDHKETPGLGGEVDNPNWKSIWEGKKVYDENGKVAIEVIKGSVGRDTPEAEHKIDGLSGATLTSRGVENMFHYWLGENGYREFLTRLQQGELQ